MRTHNIKNIIKKTAALGAAGLIGVIGMTACSTTAKPDTNVAPELAFEGAERVSIRGADGVLAESSLRTQDPVPVTAEYVPLWGEGIEWDDFEITSGTITTWRGGPEGREIDLAEDMHRACSWLTIPGLPEEVLLTEVSVAGGHGWVNRLTDAPASGIYNPSLVCVSLDQNDPFANLDAKTEKLVAELEGKPVSVAFEVTEPGLVEVLPDA